MSFRPSSITGSSSCISWRARWGTATVIRSFHLRPGDSLFFDADAPHGPDELIRLPVRYLSVISYPQGGG